MSYLDESEYDDRDERSRDERGRDERGRDERGRDERGRDERDRDGEPRGRPSRPARPAWDAGTYGARDELRRPAPPGDRYPEPYPPAPYAADPRPSDPYSSDPYPADPYPSDPYPVESYTAPRRDRPGYDRPPFDPGPPPYDPGPPPLRPGPASFDAGTSFAAGTDFGTGGGFGTEGGSRSLAPLPYESSWQDQEGSADPYPPQRYPGGADDPPAQPDPPKAGRNLPAAIGVGLGLGAIAAASLIFWRPAFLGVLVVVVGIGIWELVRAIRLSGVNPPLIPLVGGGALMTGLAWWGQADALTFGLLVTVLAAMVWRLADGVAGYGRDVSSAALIAVYLPFLAGFAAMLASSPDGDLRVVVMLAGVVLSDTGGYIAGARLGRHPMAPSVSPKKSWEGLVGSLLATGLGGAVLLHFVFHVHWYWGVLFGLAVSTASVIGDLGESMLKRDLGVKDMSNLLPGHGGFMDRLDSILFAAPTAYVLLAVFAPAG
jgi:phosphatidate cytidylyltransferase